MQVLNIGSKLKKTHKHRENMQIPHKKGLHNKGIVLTVLPCTYDLLLSISFLQELLQCRPVLSAVVLMVKTRPIAMYVREMREVFPDSLFWWF